MPRRGSILLGVSFFAFICWIIAMATDIAWADQTNGEGLPQQPIPRETHVDTWFTCTSQQAPNGADLPPICFRNSDDELSCQEYKDRFRVVQAFLVMVGILLIPLMICSALDRFALLSDVQHRLGPRTILIGFNALLIMFSIVSFAVAFSIPKTQLCDRDEFADAPGFMWGPSPFFTALICLLSIIGLIIAAIKDGYKHPVTEVVVVPVATQPQPVLVPQTQPVVVARH